MVSSSRLLVSPTFESKLVDLHNLETKLHDESWGLANNNGDMMDHDGLCYGFDEFDVLFGLPGLPHGAMWMP